MDVAPRFLRLPDVAEILNISEYQARVLVRSGELPGIQIGGRREWRVERNVLEAFIQRQYEQPRSTPSDPTELADAPVDGAAD